MNPQSHDATALTQKGRSAYDGAAFRKAVARARRNRTMTMVRKNRAMVQRTTWGMRNPLQLWRVRPTRQP